MTPEAWATVACTVLLALCGAVYKSLASRFDRFEGKLDEFDNCLHRIESEVKDSVADLRERVVKLEPRARRRQ